MEDFQWSQHAQDNLEDRQISESWVSRALQSPDLKEFWAEDGNLHYLKAIPEHGRQVLHVVVDPPLSPPQIVTFFFDRRFSRLRRRKRR